MNEDFENILLNRVSVPKDYLSSSLNYLPKFYDLRMLPAKLVRDIYKISKSLLELNQAYKSSGISLDLDKEFVNNLEYNVSYIEEYFNYLEKRNVN